MIIYILSFRFPRLLDRGLFFVYYFSMNKPTTTQIIQAVLDVITAIGMALLAIFK